MQMTSVKDEAEGNVVDATGGLRVPWRRGRAGISDAAGEMRVCQIAVSAAAGRAAKVVQEAYAIYFNTSLTEEPLIER